MKNETEWDNVIVSKEKTDWMWVIQMLTLGAFGIAICYYGKVTGMLWERIDELQLKVELLTIDSNIEK